MVQGLRQTPYDTLAHCVHKCQKQALKSGWDCAEAVGGGVLIPQGHRGDSEEGEVQSFVVPVTNGIQLETRRHNRRPPVPADSSTATGDVSLIIVFTALAPLFVTDALMVKFLQSLLLNICLSDSLSDSLSDTLLRNICLSNSLCRYSSV